MNTTPPPLVRPKRGEDQSFPLLGRKVRSDPGKSGSRLATKSEMAARRCNQRYRSVACSSGLVGGAGPLFVIAVLLLAVSGCASAPASATPGNSRGADPTPAYRAAASPTSGIPAGLTPARSPSALAGVNDFLYQLQDLDLDAIGTTAYDLVVMDYSSDGREAGEFTREQISALQDSPGGPKIVLAYLSIGEAEDYRYYWRSEWEEDGAAWLEGENPDWPGNFKARYWDPGWQSVVFDYAGRILAAGFDGAYLDIIDAYEYFADRGRTTAAQEMADFVAAVAAFFRVRDPGFYIFPQNAPELAGLTTGYLDNVDGIGQEDLYYGYDADDRPTPPSVTLELERHLDRFRNAGKLVLTVDYAASPAHVTDAYARARAKGYVPLATVRGLDRLTVSPGQEPD